VQENARPRAATHWMRSGAGGPGWTMLRIVSSLASRASLF
jgi:hypothetical protein